MLASRIFSLLSLPAIATAQTLRGTAVERADNAPVPGVVMLLVDTAGRVVGRALTNERGEFRLAAGAPGNYRVRTLRIGYRPVLSAPHQLRSGEELRETFALSSIPVTLDTIRVATRSVCRAFPDSAGPLATVWEQARTALTATQLTAGTQALRATSVRHHRTLEAYSRRTLQQTSVVDSGYVLKPWRSLSADSLRRFGYVHDGADGGKTYHAPDQDVLLSNEFVEDHCFRLARANEESLIGIAFEPTRERSRIPDIRGTLWLDRKSSELRRMEFWYANTGTRGIEDAGGDMDYVRLADGTWTILRWDIRMPVLEQRPAQSSGVPGVRPEPQIRLREWRMSGGELLLLVRGADTILSKPSAIAAVPAPVIKPAVPVVPSTPAVASDSVVAMKPVEVSAPRMLSEFDERRVDGLGHFLTRAELAKQEARALPDVLSQLPGLRIARADGQAFVTSGRGVVTSLNERPQISRRFERAPNRACYADVFVDGLPMYSGKPSETFFDIGSLTPVMVEGIEYYASPAQTPVKYSRPGAACGTLLIWTRKPGRQ